MGILGQGITTKSLAEKAPVVTKRALLTYDDDDADDDADDDDDGRRTPRHCIGTPEVCQKGLFTYN